jgi:hypothetical protein
VEAVLVRARDFQWPADDGNRKLMRETRHEFRPAITGERIDWSMRLRNDFVLEARDQIDAMGWSELPHHDPRASTR